LYRVNVTVDESAARAALVWAPTWQIEPWLQLSLDDRSLLGAYIIVLTKTESLRSLHTGRNPAYILFTPDIDQMNGSDRRAATGSVQRLDSHVITDLKTLFSYLNFTNQLSSVDRVKSYRGSVNLTQTNPFVMTISGTRISRIAHTMRGLDDIRHKPRW